MNKLKVYRVSYFDPSDKSGQWKHAAVAAPSFSRSIEGFIAEFGLGLEITEVQDTRQFIDVVVNCECGNK